MDASVLTERQQGQKHPAPQRPREPAPHRSAPTEERAEWSERYVAWFIAQTPQEGPLPPDISPTRRYEVEYAYCMLDPQRYERETQEEMRRPDLNLH